MMIPGISHAKTDENATSNRSILAPVNTVITQHTQQRSPPHNIGLNLQAAPVINVGIPYNNRNIGLTNSYNWNAERFPDNWLYSSAIGCHCEPITFTIRIISAIPIPKASQI